MCWRRMQYEKRGIIISIIFITGLSGVGKSTVLQQLKEEGYNIIDTDNGYVKEINNGEMTERVWDEEKIEQVLEKYKESHLFISGCYSNQGKFYPYFDHVVLLKAELKVMIDRINNRASNVYGKSPEERAEIMDSYENILPLLEKSCSTIIDTTYAGVDSICVCLKDLL